MELLRFRALRNSSTSHRWVVMEARPLRPAHRGLKWGRQRATGSNCGPKHHEDDQGEIKQDECSPFVQIPELAGHQERCRK